MDKKWNVLVTRFFPGDAIKALEEKCNVTVCNQLQALDKDELIQRVKDINLLIIVGDTVDEEILMNAPNLKIVADIWGRGRGVDQNACKERGIRIITSPITLKWINHSEAEHAMMLLLAATRRLLEADAFVRGGQFTQHEQANRDMLGVGLNGKTLGIIGGAMWSGDEMVKRAAAFNLNILYWDNVHNETMEKLGAKYTEFEQLLKSCDFFILMSTKREGYLLDAPQFNMMKRGAFLVNVTRGTLINETELVRALSDGRLAGAGLDKFEHEPFPVPGLTKLKNVVLTPHSDGALLIERNMIYQSVVDQCLEFIN